MKTKEMIKKIFPIPKNKPIENKHMSSFFFAMFIMFFFMFVANRYTMNIIMCMIMLMFSLSFKTWQMIRDLEN